MKSGLSVYSDPVCIHGLLDVTATTVVYTIVQHPSWLISLTVHCTLNSSQLRPDLPEAVPPGRRWAAIAFQTQEY